MKCEKCNKIVEDLVEVTTANGVELWCDDCVDADAFLCEHCNELVSSDFCTGVISDGNMEIWCQDCINLHAVYCDHCGQLIDSDEAQYISSSDGYTCPQCLENYSICENCNNWYPIQELCWNESLGEYLCEECNEEINASQVISEYHEYSHPWIFLGDSSECHLGVELELDEGGEDSDNASIIREAITDNDDLLFCTLDGSLYDGFEMVSMPATLEYHIHSYDWLKGMDKARSLDYTSYASGRCGLHIHLERRYMENSNIDIEKALAILMTNNVAFLEDFSFRDGLTDYCSFDKFKEVGKFTNFQKNYKKYISQLDRIARRCTTHDNAVNFENGNTIELRFFRGTLNYTRFIASLELAQMIADILRHAASYTAVASVTYSTFKHIAKQRGYSHYLEFLAKLHITKGGTY